MIYLGILLFILLVVVHELGHFLAARRSGVVVEEFGLGFPPRITGKKFTKNGTFYSINWLPLGGFVKLKGEHDVDDEPGSYGAASFRQKTFIILSGVGMNLLAAWAIITVLCLVGLPRLVDNQFTVASDTNITESSVVVGYVEPDSPADVAGLLAGDKLRTIGNQNVEEASQIGPLAESLAGQTVEVKYENGQGELSSTIVTFDTERGDDGFFGLQPGDYIVERSTWSAPLRALGLTAQFSWLTLQGLGNTLADLVQGRGSEAAANVAGPVGIMVLLNDVSQAGWPLLMFFIALISITLAVMNILPIPALDGGRLFVSGLYKILKKPLNAKTEERIHATGMVVLLSLVALITVVDVRRFL